MEFTDLQLTLTGVVITAVALLILFDRLRKPRPRRPIRPVKRSAVRFRPQRTAMLFQGPPIEYLPTRKLAVERRAEPVPPAPMASPAPVVVSHIPVVLPSDARDTVTIEMTGLFDQSNPQPATPHRTHAFPAVTIDAELWERLISSMPKHDLLTAGGEQADVAFAREHQRRTMDLAPGAVEAKYQVVGEEAVREWPIGLIQQSALQALLDADEPFTGLVVSIGVNDSDSSMWHSQGLMHSVGAYIGELLRDTDFACRTDFDEFVMVCRGENGAQSQRRLNHISERLWDYQLRGIGACSILFSWGGLQVQDQPLTEAIASAVDRMRQTKRLSSPGTLARAHRAAV